MELTHAINHQDGPSRIQVCRIQQRRSEINSMRLPAPGRAEQLAALSSDLHRSSQTTSVIHGSACVFYHFWPVRCMDVMYKLKVGSRLLTGETRAMGKFQNVVLSVLSAHLLFPSVKMAFPARPAHSEA